MCKELDLQVEAWETLIRLMEEDNTHHDLAVESNRRLLELRDRHLLSLAKPPELSVVGSRGHKDFARLIESRGRA